MYQLSRTAGRAQPLPRQELAGLNRLTSGVQPGHFGSMDFETISTDAFGRSLKGIGLNLLVRDVPRQCAFLNTVFDLKSHQVTADFAILTYGDQLFQLHADATYHANP